MNSFMFVNEFKNSYQPSDNIITENILSSSVRNKSMTTSAVKIRRPKNAFMLYRQAVHPRILSANSSLHNKDISRTAGEMWRNEKEEVRKYYERKADEERLYHSKKFPGYIYKPQQRKTRRLRTGSFNSLLRSSTDIQLIYHKAESIPTSDKINMKTQNYIIQSQNESTNEDDILNTPPTQCLDDSILKTFLDDLNFDIFSPVDELIFSLCS
uniref:SexM protein n=1 Tax=Phycomyces nitens TaxID=269771 RepID=A0A078N0E8_9FUNG|nr:SexM protein [Phycomyces nitens]